MCCVYWLMNLVVVEFVLCLLLVVLLGFIVYLGYWIIGKIKKICIIKG